MRAIRVGGYGGPEVLKVQEIDRPQPGRGEALVRIVAIGINYMDVYQRSGRYGADLPFTPGAEASGTVEAVGEGVSEIKVGDRVAYTGIPGAYAEYAIVRAERLIKLPDAISFEQGAAFPLQGTTAHYLLESFYHVSRETTVLIHAAAGGVGLLLTQMAKHLGARVIGTTSSGEKATIAKEAGADDIILYTKTDFAEETKKLTNGRGVDLILDGVGKATFPGDLEAVRVRGTVVVYGSSSGAADPVSPNSFMAKSIMVGGGSLQNYIATREELERRASAVLSGIRDGWLKLRIDRTFSLDQAPEAHRLLESRQTSGKLLLKP